MTEHHYGERPRVVAELDVCLAEMLFYQYLPVRLAGREHNVVESRLWPLHGLLALCDADYIIDRGRTRWAQCNTYLTVKRLWVEPGRNLNRPGWHADGFMSDDVNYVWYDHDPTIFNVSGFRVDQDHAKSMTQFAAQARPENDVTYPPGTLLALDQFNVHRTADPEGSHVRTFVKVSYSPDRYDLEGNAHNYLLDYDWPMHPRAKERNHPTSKPH